MDKPKKLRARKPMARLLHEVVLRFDRFYASKGSCTHFSRLPMDLAKQAITTQRAISDFNRSYCRWIEQNERFKPENYLPEKKF
jgi:hypothetical protein